MPVNNNSPIDNTTMNPLFAGIIGLLIALFFRIINKNLIQSIKVEDDFKIINNDLVVDGPNKDDYEIINGELFKN